MKHKNGLRKVGKKVKILPKKFVDYKCYPKNINNLKDVCDALATASEGRDKINALLFLNSHYLICVGIQGEGYKVDLPFDSSLDSAYKSLYDYMIPARIIE